MSVARGTCIGMILAILLLVAGGCQLGIGAQSAAPPPPPPLPTPTANDQKIIDGYLQVNYIPTCALSSVPFTWVAPIRLTDLRSGSVIYLNRNGTPMGRRNPDYKSEEGQATLQAALTDSAIVEQIVARPECPEKVYSPTVNQKDGWPDAYAVDIGNPPMPKVAMVASPMYFTTPPQFAYPGWRGAYCWPVGEVSRECEDTAEWKGFGSADALGGGSGTRFHVAILGDEGNPGMVRRVRVLPVREEWSLRKLGNVLLVGAEVHKFVATKGTTLEKFVMPRLPAGNYILIADYESALGEVEYGFKVEVRGERK